MDVVARAAAVGFVAAHRAAMDSFGALDSEAGTSEHIG